MPPACRRMPVYIDAMSFAIALDDLMDTLPAKRAYVKDQMRRAALSILLNLEEGGAEIRPREKARLYRLAKRSAAECGAGLHFLAAIHPPSKAMADQLDRRAGGLSRQLHRLALSHLRQPTPARRAP